ncbi:SWI/SNF-related matrix-associated actin-dependent regulator of chromatin subfamily A containing DEAD/H box 1B-like [Babylonia areolata]|uniref:SWI/SNF-related matrix-associated actin-dependent regulator of chromatin subfamily A containing DEAD/H box 1B-like n=1 Tax=Babylonia areolata TaxID=304850 RepID=UPI003FD2EE1C
MSENGSLSSLLKYRFNRRPADQLKHSPSSGTSGQSQQGTQNGGGGVAASAKSCADVNGVAASSKPCGMAGDPSNGEQTSQAAVGVSGTRAVQTPQSDGAQPTKAVQWENQLHRMFPSSTPLHVKAAVAAACRAGSLEAGVEYLLKGHTAVKRSHEDMDRDDAEGSQAKRLHMSSADTPDSQKTLPPLSQPSSQQHTESCSLTDTQRTNSSSLSPSQETSIQFLQGAFPALLPERLRQALEDCHGNTDQAVMVLSREVKVTETTQPQASSTHATRSSKHVNHESLSLSDEEDDFDEEEDEDSDDSVDDDRSSSRQELILSFLEEATLAELTVLPGCSRKKAEILVDLRPFGSWDNLIEKVQGSKQLSLSLVQGCQEIIQLRNVVVRLMKQCEHISGQMESVVSRLRSSPDQGPSQQEDGQITSQPSLLNSQYELKPYQLIGLNWLRIMHAQELNGILADEMGLGKTIQAISFLAHLMEEGEKGPHVIIVPSSTIENWLRELSAWCPALGVVVYYGSQEERRATRHSIMYEGRDNFHVLLTTYNMATGGVEDRSLFKKFQFHYAVFDEGHMLKNMSSLRFQNLMKISADRRLLLTGTPLQNNLLELMSLLCFVMPDIFQGKTTSLKKIFSMISRGDGEQGKYEKERIAHAQRIMRPFVLRRLKKDVLMQLPKKEEEVQYCPLLPHQRALYDTLLHTFSQDVAGGGEGGGGIAMFMQLRKVANHPLLVRHHYDDRRLLQMANTLAKEPSHKERGALPKLIMEDMAQMNDFDLITLCQQYKKHLGKYELDSSWIGKSAKLSQLDGLLDTLRQQGDRVLLFSQFTMMLDIIEVFLKQKKMRYIRLDGSTPVTDRQQLIDQYNEDPDIFVFLLSTRAGGLGINLTAANTIILHDIDFNPYNDKQAEDRCHRLGQKRTVRIIRLIASHTVEEGMLRCAQAKLRLEQDVTTIANDDSEETKADVALLLREAISKVRASEECPTLTSANTPASATPSDTS